MSHRKSQKLSIVCLINDTEIEVDNFFHYTTLESAFKVRPLPVHDHSVVTHTEC